MYKRRQLIPFLLLLALVGAATPAQAQLGGLTKKIKDKVEKRIEKKTDQAIEDALNTVECVATDTACQEQAKKDGKGVKVVEGSAALSPGHGVWTNYDFKPGDRIIFADDFSKDEVGDFPRRLEFKGGQLEIVEWNNGRWLRGGSNSRFYIPLQETLPERFTLEFDLVGHGNAMLLVFDGAENNQTKRLFVGQKAGSLNTGSINAEGSFGVDTGDPDNSPPMNAKPVHIAVSVDGQHVKMYANETRVFNAPNGDLGRSKKIFVDVNGWNAELPRMIAGIRIAAGGKKLYDALSEKGRVATQGIYFDVGSDRIRPESTPTLKEISTMLKEHPELKLTIEGHTDNVGSAESNQTLSQKRAEAVRQQLIKTYAVDEGRLQAKGFGAGKPAGSNDTPDGRQQNRRVELVKL